MSPKNNSKQDIESEEITKSYKRKCGFSKIHEDEEKAIRKNIRANFRKQKVVQSRPATAER